MSDSFYSALFEKNYYATINDSGIFCAKCNIPDKNQKYILNPWHIILWENFFEEKKKIGKKKHEQFFKYFSPIFTSKIFNENFNHEDKTKLILEYGSYLKLIFQSRLHVEGYASTFDNVFNLLLNKTSLTTMTIIKMSTHNNLLNNPNHQKHNHPSRSPLPITPLNIPLTILPINFLQNK